MFGKSFFFNTQVKVLISQPLFTHVSQQAADS